MKTAPPTQPAPRAAFTRVELAAVLGALALLAAVALPALARSREPGQRAACVNNLRQLGQALLMFSAENDDLFPPRLGGTNAWPLKLARYLGDTALLRCPSDAPNPATLPTELAPRSYIFNGWTDYAGSFPPSGFAMPEKAIPLPAETIAFGEKDSFSFHYWMNYSFLDDISELEQTRHGRTFGDPNTGGSNYAFADGGVRFLKFGRSFYPVNLWAVVDAWRTNGGPSAF